MVTIIIPCRNEEDSICNCLNSIANQTFPKANMEIFLIDGLSTDKTLDIVRSFRKEIIDIKILSNPKKSAPTALNLGIDHANGDIIVRMDAHATYHPEYLDKCVQYANKNTENDVVGGVLEVIASKKTIAGDLIAMILSSSFGVGGSAYRGKHDLRGKQLVDSVPFGCYHKSLFDKVGKFNENLLRSQDYELYKRVQSYGGKIYLYPDIIATYKSRSTLGSYFKHMFKSGLWIILRFKWTVSPVAIRHIIPFIFSLFCTVGFLISLFFYLPRLLYIGIMTIYLGLAIISSVKMAKNNRKISPLIFGVPILFLTHFIYGAGSFIGSIKLAGLYLFGDKKNECR